MAMLTRAAILAANDLPRVKIKVPEWGGEVLVRGMTAGERDRLELEMARDTREGELSANIRARHAAACIVDDKGEPIFLEEDVEALGRKSGAAMGRVYAKIMALSAVTGGDVEDAAGNS